MTTNFGPILRTRWPAQDQVLVVGQQLGFAVVEHQAVDPLEQLAARRRAPFESTGPSCRRPRAGGRAPARAPSAAWPASRWPGRRNSQRRNSPESTGLEIAEHVELRCRASRGRSCSACTCPSSGTSCRRARPAGRRCRCRGWRGTRCAPAGQSSPTTPTSRTGVKKLAA